MDFTQLGEDHNIILQENAVENYFNFKFHAFYVLHNLLPLLKTKRGAYAPLRLIH